MIDENFKRLFIATHLLYPNSAQARDIVFQISTQLRAKIEKAQPKDQLGIYFSALVQIYRRVSTIKSGFKFFEFKDQKLNDWKNILKKCNTNEILIFLGIAVLKIEISDIARILKFSPNQVRYLFGLAIRKAVASQESTNDGFQQPQVLAFKYRHYKDSDVTYSNLLEKVVDFVFISPASPKRTTFDHFSRENEIHISERNQGNIGFLFGKISALCAELSNIEIDEPFLIEFQKEAKTFAQKSRLQIRLEWRWVGVISVITISVLMFFLRPDFRQIFVQNSSVAAIEVKEIAFKVAGNRTEETNQIPTQSAGQTQTIADSTLDPGAVSIDVSPVSPIVAVKISDAGPNVAASKKPDSPAAKPNLAQPVTQKPEPKEPITNPSVATTPPAASVAGLPENSTVAQEEPPNSGLQVSGQPSNGVFRAELYVKDLEQMSTFTKERIVGFGGKKAGEVELGWVKNSKTTYFHFAIPEENIEKLKTDLSKLGTLKISFHSHPRIMPAGSKRVILEVKQGE